MNLEQYTKLLDNFKPNLYDNNINLSIKNAMYMKMKNRIDLSINISKQVI